MLLLIKFILAHLIADFFLQPNSWVKNKEEKLLRSGKLYLHFIIHGIIFYLIVWDLTLWKAILIILVSHYIIDILKLLLQTEKTKRLYFFLDQILHFAILFIVWYYNQDEIKSIQFFANEDWLVVFTAALFLITPSGIIIRNVLYPWQPTSIDGGKNAGMYIGFVERLLILIFILFGQWQAIGFLLAAKSVFRFKDIQNDKERTLTEYILLGTLISYAIAILIGILVVKLIK